MAIAGLHNVSVLDSCFLGGSRSRRNDGGMGSTRGSSLLQMWREFEEEHMVNQARERSPDQLNRTDGLINVLSPVNVSDSNRTERRNHQENASLGMIECETWSESRNGSHDEHEVSSNSSCENSSDFGEAERERVRQIFREWMNSGIREHSSNTSTVNNSSRAEWLAQNEQERVRIIREWVEMNSQQRGPPGVNIEEQSTEVGSQIGRISDEPALNQNDGHIHHNEMVRKGIRKLRGRQALLDMLKKAEKERQRELQELMEQRAVTRFSHRNRIQALLRGRFLLNGRLTENIRPSSTAESELGFLRQRQTVSGLREGVFSRLDDSGSVQLTNNQCEASSSTDMDTAIIEHATGGNLLVLNEHLPPPESNNVQNCSPQLLDGNYLCATRRINTEREESALYVDLVHQSVLGCELRDGHSVSARINYEQGVDEIRDLFNFDEQYPNTLQIKWTSQNEQSSSTIELVERRKMFDGTSHNAPSSNLRDQQSPATEFLERTDENEENSSRTSTRGLGENGEQDNMGNLSDISNEPFEMGDESSDAGGFPNHSRVAENYESVMMVPESTLREGRLQEEVLENVGNVGQRRTIEYNDWIESSEGHMSEHRQNNNAGEWSQHMLGNGDGDIPHLQVAPETWNEDHGFQEAVQNWLGRSDHEAFRISRVDAFHFPDDDNVYRMELRELLSRRSVSNLLQSGFRESLDQLLQSYVERQSHAYVDWELHEDTTSSAPAELDLDQQSRDPGVHPDNAAHGPDDIPVPPTPPSQPLWDMHPRYRHESWPVSNQRFGIEWDIINDLRIDMAMLQQKMNDMQKMMETCVDMQLELQRSIRQEVSAVLNRSNVSPGTNEELPVDKSKWEYVRKGVCCICCESNIDSLLYRCGHLCTCSKCANELMRRRQKCPMCQAPVVEVIRAYSIQ